MRGSMGDDGPPSKFFRGGGSPGWGGRGGDRDQNGGGFRGGRGQGNYTQRPSGGGGWGFRGKLKNLYILSSTFYHLSGISFGLNRINVFLKLNVLLHQMYKVLKCQNLLQ